jgi:hypothetical protein
VTALAESFLGGNIVLSDLGRNILKVLCLYHDFGGYLNKEAVAREQEIINRFKKVSRLDRRLLDSRIVCELLRLNGEKTSSTEEATIEVLDDSVNSAVQLLRRRKFANDDVRDLVVFLLQVQDNPNLFNHFKNNFNNMGFSLSESELDTIFACLKIAENFVNGRWLWKRKLYPVTVLQQQDLGERTGHPHKVTLEDIPFMLTLTIRTLAKSGITPRVYIDRLNEILSPGSHFLKLLMSYQEESPLLICDKLYLYLLGAQEPSASCIGALLNDGIKMSANASDEVFQLAQIAGLPIHLEEIAQNCAALTKSAVALTAEMVAELYHKNWQLFHRNVCRKIIERLPY